MNILQAYIKKKPFIVLILGLPCSNKSLIAKELYNDFKSSLPKLLLININDYFKDKYIEKEIDGYKFNLYDQPENIDWDTINIEVNDKKENGIIIYGTYLEPQKINFNIDFIYFIDLNNSICKEFLINKKLLITNFNEKYDENMTPELESEYNKKVNIYFDNILVENFNKLREIVKNDLVVNKFFNIKENNTFDDIYDKLFNKLMENINTKLKEMYNIKGSH